MAVNFANARPLAVAIPLGLLLAASSAAGASHTPAATPLNDLGAGLYLGQFEGGLYENGANVPPSDHNAAGITHAAAITLLSSSGTPMAGGKIVMVSIGMSNTTQEFCSSASGPPCDSFTFMGLAGADPNVNHTSLIIVNGAAGGQAASTWDSPTDSNYDRVRDTRLTPAGVTEQQVQVAWVKVANAGPTLPLPSASSDAYSLETSTGNIARALKLRYPNLQAVFLSSRIYAGYATTSLNPEPYAYESGLAMKWLVQAQVNQMRGAPIDPRAGNLDYDGGIAPWIGWGPYFWADGLIPRSDGLTWAATDFAADGTHPATNGRAKAGSMLHSFFTTSPFTTCWFRLDTDADGISDVCEAGDEDGDGYDDGDETHVGTDPLLPCGGISAWPADFFAGGIPDSTNRITIGDLTSFLAPVRHLNTSPLEPGYAVRWDIDPGPGLFTEHINITDLTSLIVVAPPMLGGERAFNGPPCL